jgi:hypothetical protein
MLFLPPAIKFLSLFPGLFSYTYSSAILSTSLSLFMFQRVNVDPVLRLWNVIDVVCIADISETYSLRLQDKIISFKNRTSVFLNGKGVDLQTQYAQLNTIAIQSLDF